MKFIRNENVDPRELDRANRNPNSMPEAEYQQLVANMRANGFCTQPILVRELPGGALEIIDGHHRTSAAISAGLRTIPAVVIEADDNEALVLGLSHNRLRGELDSRAVAELLQQLEAQLGRDALSATGFQQTEIEALLASVSIADPVADLLSAGSVSASIEDTEQPPERGAHELKFEFTTVEALRAAKRTLSKAAGRGEKKLSRTAALLKLLGLDEHVANE